jgi:hypothetical protein
VVAINVRTRLRAHPNLRRLVFWISLGVMLTAGLTGLIWRLLSGEFGRGPMAAMALGIGALVVALVYGLLEFTSPTFHPESHLFQWADVDTLRSLARRDQLDAATREWARSLADRIAVVLPGRSAPAHGQSQPKTPAVRRP